MDPFVGEIRTFGFNFAPSDHAFCNGQLMPIQQSTALFSLLGTMYGGNGSTTYALPNLLGRGPLHKGQGPGLSDYVQGDIEGGDTITLNAAQMAPHRHGLNGAAGMGTKRLPAGSTLAADTAPGIDFYAPSSAGQPVSLSPGSMTVAGQGQAYGNMQPFLAINFCIALSGIYPSRN